MDLIQFHLICQMLSNFSGVESEGQHLSYEKGKEHFHVVFTKSLKRAREISTFHVAVVQRNVQEGVMSCCCCCFFANINLLLFCHFCCRCRHRCLTPYCCDPEILLPR